MWAAGSLPAWESWLIQKMKAHRLDNTRILEQLSRHLADLTTRVRLPTDSRVIPHQAQRWLNLRPVRQEKTYLVFALPEPLSIAPPATSHPGLAGLLRQARTLSQQHIYLRGFVQEDYWPKEDIPGVERLELRWEEQDLLDSIDMRFDLFRTEVQTQVTIEQFGHLFQEYGDLAPMGGQPYSQADRRLAVLANGSLGRLVRAAQDLIQKLVTDENLLYLDETHLAAIEKREEYKHAA
jgi:hypothetical protein